ncbi:cyclin 4 [Cystoisospora suis]|uniref:Cyclin 4 n=1 Tax=Cystoisospora suis TaxID=483139 RepID=A0A2C6L9Z5_9APIC|nr:cyclin 4 [Cystoisospora suis]
MANHVVLMPQKLLKTPPSVRDGLSREVELDQRVYGCQLIQKAGILLKLEAVSIASAQTILHRFYFRRSLKQFDVRRVATACLLLACKLEEDQHRVTHFIGTIHLLTQLEDSSPKKVILTEENLDDFLIPIDSEVCTPQHDKDEEEEKLTCPSLERLPDYSLPPSILLTSLLSFFFSSSV